MTALPAVTEGEELPALELTPDLGQVIRFCGLTWVFPAFFYDVEAARAQGMPGTLLPGPLKLGLIYRAIDDWLGDRGFIRHVRAAHRRPDDGRRAGGAKPAGDHAAERGGRRGVLHDAELLDVRAGMPAARQLKMPPEDRSAGNQFFFEVHRHRRSVAPPFPAV